MKQRLLIFLSLVVVVAIVFIPGNDEPELSKKGLTSIELPPIDNPEREREHEDSPHLAMQHDFEMMVDRKLGYVPTQRMINAYRRIEKQYFDKSNQVAEQAAIQGVTWTERGPYAVGGRSRTGMFDPNDNTAKKFWSGAVGGGLWYIDDITDPEAIWQQETSIMTNLAVSSMAYDPSNTQTFYLGTGQGYTGIIRGAGIWKSSDGGDNWDQLASTTGADFAFVQKVAVNSQGIVFAATTFGLYRSADGGNSWVEEIDGRFGDIEIASNGTIYATTGVSSSGSIHRSTDGGETWTEVTPPNTTSARRTEVATAPSDPSVIYAVASGGSGTQDIAYFKKSEDAGDTWTDITIPLYSEQSNCAEGSQHYTRGQAFFDLILKVHPENPDIVFAGGIDNHRSRDGGQNWQLISYWNGRQCDDYAHADSHDMTFRPGHPNTLVVMNDGGVDYAANAGIVSQDTDWQRRVRGLQTVMFYYAAAVNEVRSSVMLAGAQDNGTIRFDEPGINDGFRTRGGDGTFCFINPSDPSVMISSFPGHVYDLSTDGGFTWTRLVGDGNSGRFINPTDMDWEAGILYAADGNNQLTRIKNIPNDPGGVANVSIPEFNGTVSAVKVSPYTTNRVFVGIQDTEVGGRLFMVDDADGGVPTVTDITGDLGENRGSYLRSIDIGASDDQLLITFSNFGGTSVFETTDGGTSWRDIEDNLPDIPVMWGLYNPENREQVILATQMGIWTSNDITGNPGWEPSNEGLASTRIDHLLYRPADQTVFAATLGRGLFSSDIFATTKKADFKTDQIVGYVGLPVHFEDNSLLANDSYSWDFGDGGSSSLANPSHTYDTPGTYTVSLSIDGGADVATFTDYVTILPTLPADYTLEDGGDFESNPEHFTSAAIMNGMNLWERGTPGNALNEPTSGTTVWKTRLDEDLGNPGKHIQFGLYTPAFDFSAGDSEYIMSFQMAGETSFANLPTAMQVHYSVDGGVNWQTLGSTNGDPGAENWYNQGPNLQFSINREIFIDKMGWSINQNPAQESRYNLNFLSGQPHVSFRFAVGMFPNLVNGSGEIVGYDVDGYMIDDFQILAQAPSASFSVSAPAGFQGDEFEFTYTSNGADTFHWDFGDGNTSTDMNPTHTYNDAGVYDVTLTATANGVPAEATQVGAVSILPDREVPYLLADGGDFESNFNDFIAINLAGTPFELGVSTVTGKDGTASGTRAWVTGIDQDEYLDNSEAVLVTPLFNFGDQAKLYTLEFKAKFDFEPEYDGFIIRYTTDRGATWTTLNDNLEEGWYNEETASDAIWGANVPIFGDDTDGEFMTFSTDVTFLFPNEVAFQFLFATDINTVEVGAAIDDFQITLTDADPPVADFTVELGNGCSGQQVVFTDASTGTIQEYDWDFGAGANPQTATGPGPHTVSYINPGFSSPKLTVSNVFSQEDTEEKVDVVQTGATHTPSFSREPTSNRTEILTATQGDAYQWYLNSNPIDGATNQMHEATESGNYTVDVTIDGCTVQTNQQTVITSVENNNEFARGVTIYPNPVKDIMNVKVSNEEVGDVRIKIHTSNGVTISDRTVRKSQFDAEYQISMAELKAGVYLVEVSTENGKAVKRVVREE